MVVDVLRTTVGADKVEEYTLQRASKAMITGGRINPGKACSGSYGVHAAS